jgi:glycosyltransferase involved in cell wall biosynthesis
LHGKDHDKDPQEHIRMTTVTVIIPCLNEEKTIGHVLRAIMDQDYPGELMDVVIADGLSSDNTRKRIAEFCAVNSGLPVHVIDNPKREIPAGLNLAIRSAKGDVIVRMDGHSLPEPDYISHCVENLSAHRGDNVGGRWIIVPGEDTWIARGIAAAAAHPLGVGNVKYRISGEAGPVDTVPFGSYYRSLFDEVGHFDETLLTNEDYEFNTRLREKGKIIWFDPTIACRYFSRPDIGSLARQYWRYGFWKAKMVRRYPDSIKPRQFMPPVFVAGLVLLLLAGMIFHPIFLGLLAIFLLYMGIIVSASLPEAARRKDPSLIVSIPLAIMTMHFTWGSGFLTSIVKK